MKDIHPRLAELKAMYDVEEATYKLINELFEAFKQVGRTRCSLEQKELAPILDNYSFVIRNKAMEELRNMGFSINYNYYQEIREIHWYG